MTSRFKEYGLAHENFGTEDGLRLTKTKILSALLKDAKKCYQFFNESNCH